MQRQQRQKSVHSKLHASAHAHHTKQEHKRSRVWMRVLFSLLMILFVGVCGYVLFFSPLTKITTTTVDGVQTLSQEELRTHVQEQTSGVILSYIPRNHYPVVSSKALEASLQEHFRRIETVHVTKQFPHGIRMDVTERESVLVWCRNEEKDNCYMMDRGGVLYAQADFGSDEIVQNNLVTIVDRSGREVTLYDRVLREETLGHILAHRSFFQGFDGFDSEDVLTMHSRISGELAVRTTGGWDVLIDLRQEPSDVQRSVETFFKKITFAPEKDKDSTDSDEEIGAQETEGDREENTEEPNADKEEVIVAEGDVSNPTYNDRPRSELLYVDFRIDEKVFYKFKETDAEREAREKAEKEANENAVSEEGADGEEGTIESVN